MRSQRERMKSVVYNIYNVSLDLLLKSTEKKYPFYLLHFISWIESGTPEPHFSFQFFHALGLAPRFFSTTYKHPHYLNIQKVRAWFFYSLLNQNSHILIWDLYNSWKLQLDSEKCNQYNPWNTWLQWEFRGCRVHILLLAELISYNIVFLKWKKIKVWRCGIHIIPQFPLGKVSISFCLTLNLGIVPQQRKHRSTWIAALFITGSNAQLDIIHLKFQDK